MVPDSGSMSEPSSDFGPIATLPPELGERDPIRLWQVYALGMRHSIGHTEPVARLADDGRLSAIDAGSGPVFDLPDGMIDALVPEPCQRSPHSNQVRHHSMARVIDSRQYYASVSVALLWLVDG
jgi:hypothetical protein